MSATNGWSSVIALSQDLARYLRAYIYNKMVPSSFTKSYQGAEIQLVFSPQRTQLTIDTNQPDTIVLVAPLSGSIQTDTFSSFKGQVTLQANVADLEVRPATAAAGDEAASNSWTNAVYFLSPDVFSGLTVELTQGSKDDADLLTSFFNQELQDFISEPFQLPPHTRDIPDTFVPTLIRFITLAGATGGELLLLIMMDGEKPPSGDQHAAFDGSPTWDIPTGSNAVIALGDYPVLEWFASKLDADVNKKGKKRKIKFSDISVTKDPAALTATASKGSRSLDLSMSFSAKGLEASASASGIFNIGATYLVTLAVAPGDDPGTPDIVVTSTLEKSKIEVNRDNWLVIGIQALELFLQLNVPILMGQFFKQFIARLKAKAEGLITALLDALEFTKEQPLELQYATITNLALDYGVVCTLELSRPADTAPVSAGALAAETEAAWSSFLDGISAALDEPSHLPAGELVEAGSKPGPDQDAEK